MKNKILYFTTALDNEEFKKYLSYWKVSPNLSNQNFHNKLIHALALSYDVDVISVRSINHYFKKQRLAAKINKENSKIYWKYIEVRRNKIDKFLNMYKRIEFITMPDSEYIFVDALNLSLLKAAIKYRKKHSQKIIGVVTDNPNNISFLKKKYKAKLLELGKKLDGYIALTPKLESLYNLDNKPSIVIDGVSEKISDFLPIEVDGDYIYFGGSLMKEYGVYNLIEAFKDLDKPNLKLVICGHHVNTNKLYEVIGNNPNILYLGAKSYEENLSLEKNSILAINPRPINPKIDEYSIPSKTLEYLSIGALTVTVENELLKSHYGPCIIWAKSGDPKDLKEAIEKALSLTKTEREMLSLLGKNKVMQYTSLENVNNSLQRLLRELSFDE